MSDSGAGGAERVGRRRIGWGIVSTGHIAGTFARDLALLSDEAELVAVSSRNRSKAADFAQTYGFARAFGSAAEVAADPDVEVVYVASPHSDHFDSAATCLAAGKAVLVEKPLTVSPEQTDRLLDLAAERGVLCMEAMWTRVHPLIRKAAEVVASQQLGEVRHVAANFGFAFDGPDSHRLLDPEQAGGAILDAGVYPVHATQLFLGEPAQLHGYGRHGRTGVDTHAAALLTYPAVAERRAATATVLCTLEADLPTRLEIYCSAGHIQIDGFIRPDSMTIVRGHPPDAEPEVLVAQLPGRGYTLEAQEAMRCLRSGELESPLVPWADTRAVARTLSRWAASVAAAERI